MNSIKVNLWVCRLRGRSTTRAEQTNFLLHHQRDVLDFCHHEQLFHDNPHESSSGTSYKLATVHFGLRKAFFRDAFKHPPQARGGCFLFTFRNNM